VEVTSKAPSVEREVPSPRKPIIMSDSVSLVLSCSVKVLLSWNSVEHIVSPPGIAEEPSSTCFEQSEGLVFSSVLFKKNWHAEGG
jgi:hypothetical protein